MEQMCCPHQRLKTEFGNKLPPSVAKKIHMTYCTTRSSRIFEKTDSEEVKCQSRKVNSESYDQRPQPPSQQHGQHTNLKAASLLRDGSESPSHISYLFCFLKGENEVARVSYRMSLWKAGFPKGQGKEATSNETKGPKSSTRGESTQTMTSTRSTCFTS